MLRCVSDETCNLTPLLAFFFPHMSPHSPPLTPSSSPFMHQYLDFFEPFGGELQPRFPSLWCVCAVATSITERKRPALWWEDENSLQSEAAVCFQMIWSHQSHICASSPPFQQSRRNEMNNLSKWAGWELLTGSSWSACCMLIFPFLANTISCCVCPLMLSEARTSFCF